MSQVITSMHIRPTTLFV